MTLADLREWAVIILGSGALLVLFVFVLVLVLLIVRKLQDWMDSI